MKNGFLIVVMFLMTMTTFAQEKKDVTIGLGLGTEFGGIGGKLAVYPHETIGLFAGVGTMIAGPGFNAGIQLLLPSDSRVKFYLEAMYGSNASIYFEDSYYNSVFKKVYSGPTIGCGINLATKKRNYWQFSFLVPFRSQEYKNQWKAIQNMPGTITNNVLPFTTTIGYNINLNK